MQQVYVTAVDKTDRLMAGRCQTIGNDRDRQNTHD
jgi:hypothetical protein